MDMIFSAFAEVLSPFPLLMNLVGVMVGMIIGALPGLGSVVAISICLPFTFGMQPLQAMALLLGVYCGSTCGGSIAAVLINTPGTPQSAATSIDGYPLARAGKGGVAIGWALASSIFGGLFSCLVLSFAAPSVASFALRFGPLETFGLILMGLTCISSVSGKNQLKGLAAGVIGLLLACVGMSPFTPDARFTFGFYALDGGMDTVAVIVGVFAISEVIDRAERMLHEEPSSVAASSVVKMPRLADYRGRFWLLIKSSIIGTFIGILPGTGATTAAFIAYGEAQRTSPRRDRFGTGEPDSIVAAESSNNAVTGGALVPSLALGIPGDPVTAIMLATFILHGITPGVRLMVDNPGIVYGIFVALAVANLLMWPCCCVTTRIFNYLLKTPEPILMGLITVLCVLGSYGSRGNINDVAVTIGAGIAAYLLRRSGFPMPPIVIGLVLGQQFEMSIGQMMLYKADLGWWEYVSASPIALCLFAVTVLILCMPLLRRAKARS
ncbi:tripartite tricarboxylate transporter permease [Mailhella massiliensis]|uniref:Tripartite tricarboxylate transporter permease n=1 Tax=Mailhella massiliensis TaxID=1903261 RepID=A0A921AW29_9BACT|nr:tripartite tricarboxylate transporter permease [Mailhella massiliensis]HJD96823.1 tripartite tricarboxylate transporter permease [Mailhella massiliensis]